MIVVGEEGVECSRILVVVGEAGGCRGGRA